MSEDEWEGFSDYERKRAEKYGYTPQPPGYKPTPEEERAEAYRDPRRAGQYYRRPSKKQPPVKEKTFAETVLLGPPPDSDLDPDDPISQAIWRQAGPLYYTPPEKAPEGTVDPIDKMVTRFTGRLWGRAEEIRPSTKPLSYEAQRYRMRKRDLPGLELAWKRAQFGALNLGIGAVESFTFPVRPSAWGRTAQGMVGLATSKERRREAAEFAKARPAAFGLQLLGGVAGGYAAGRVIGRLRGPKTFTLKQKTAPMTVRQVTSPATKMPRGKWRSTWEITKKGGTAVVQLKDRPGYMTYYEPTAVYGLSRLGFLGVSGIRGRTATSLKSDPVVEQMLKQTQRVGFGQVQRRRERGMFANVLMTEEATEQRRTILPDVHTFVRPLPAPTLPGFAPPTVIQEQRQRQTIIAIPDLKLKQIQIQKEVQSLGSALEVPYLTLKPSPKLLLYEEKKRKKRKMDPLGAVGELRLRPVKFRSLKDVLKV